MKETLIIIGFVCVALGAKAQKSYDYGLFLGMTEAHLYTILPIPDANGLDYAVGGYYRYSLNPRYSIRGGVNAGFGRTNFQPNMIDAFGLFEFNFHPLNVKREKNLVTSYIAVGLSYLIDLPLLMTVSTSANPKMGNYMIRNIRVPFNVGVRYNVTSSMTIGAEWDLRKGYQKDYEDPDQPFFNNLLSNWRSHFGITLGYMVSNYCRICPFYDNERKKLK
ncbi:MAG: DUF6089 family protein [Bacteroidales bacterium]|jgi:hypothetical protein